MKNYIADMLAELKAELVAVDAYMSDCDDLIELYGLLVTTTGIHTTLKHVHDAWAIWRNRTKPDHKSLIPFEDLTLEVQELDRKYVAVIVKVAAKYNA